MRHLSVPSAQTQHWLERCRSEKWLAEHTGVTSLSDGNKAIPLNQTAPPEGDAAWAGNALVDLAAKGKTPSHWTEHLYPEILKSHKDDLPKAYETQGDVLIVKIEESVWHLAELIADAMLTQLPSIRLICADLGVHGDFRVRNLEPLASRDGSTETVTRIKENGYFLWVDASKVYFSARLSNERTETLESAKKLKQRLARPLIVADPYAGVGPSNPNPLLEGFLSSPCNDLLRSLMDCLSPLGLRLVYLVPSPSLFQKGPRLHPNLATSICLFPAENNPGNLVFPELTQTENRLVHTWQQVEICP